MDFTPTLVLAALVVAFINFLKDARRKNWNGVLTQLTVWGSGVVAIFLFAHAELANTMDVSGQALGTLDGTSLVLLGLSLASTGSLIVEVKKAIDTSDSAVKPKLFASSNPPP